MTPRVAVIIATYDRPDALALSLASLVAQSYPAFEAWVIGDACADLTAEVVSQFGDPRLHYFNRSRNSGSQAAPNNDGLERSTAELVAYLSHDDLWLPWHLAELVGALDQSGAELVYSLSARLGPDGVTGCLGRPAPESDLRADSCCPPSSWLVRRSALVELGGWRDPDTLDFAVDRDVLVRLTALGRCLHCHPRLTVLKFPSALFRNAYATDAATQRHYAADLQADPAALELRLLSEIAARHARHRCPKLGWLGVLRRAGVLLAGGLARLYGRNRWPLPALRVWMFQRSRRRKRRLRGLD